MDETFYAVKRFRPDLLDYEYLADEYRDGEFSSDYVLNGAPKLFDDKRQADHFAKQYGGFVVEVKVRPA